MDIPEDRVVRVLENFRIRGANRRPVLMEKDQLYLVPGYALKIGEGWVLCGYAEWVDDDEPDAQKGEPE